MENHHVKVSIGLPVHNGEKYLSQALESVLAQTYPDFELILSDNASTDRTEEICQQYAARDPRIRYYRNAENIGGGPNENRTVALSRGEYFCWLGHDDCYEPGYLAECVAVLEKNPDIVHCYSIAVPIDENGKKGAPVIRNNATSRKPHERFINIACARDFLEESYGLTRAEILKRTLLVQPYTASDRTLLAEISLYGRFHQVPKALFYKRFHSHNIYIDWRARMAWYNPKIGGKIVFPFWVQFFDYLERIRRTAISAKEKWFCRLSMLSWLAIFGKNMVKDLLYAGYMLFLPQELRKRKYDSSKNWE
jgi:glycosyltransferase involved in cell wall biosynthesis